MALTPWEELMGSQPGRGDQPISPSEEAEMLEAEEKGLCPCCKRPLNADVLLRAPF